MPPVIRKTDQSTFHFDMRFLSSATRQKLLIRHPRPEKGETILAYLLRASELNGYTTPLELLRFADMRVRELTVLKLDFRKLAAVTRCSGSDIKKMSLRKTARTAEGRVATLNGNDLPLSELRLRRGALCIQCVQESSYIQPHWHLDLMIACPIHGMVATTRCPECGSEIQWMRRGLLICHCGADISSVRPKASNPSLHPLLGLLRSKTLHIPPFPNGLSLPQELHGISVQSLLTVIRVLGKAHLTSIGRGQANAEELLLSATEVLSDWPHKFQLLLDRMSNTGDSARPWEARSYRSLFTALFTRPPRKTSSELQFLKHAIVLHLARRDKHGLLDPKLKTILGDAMHDRLTRSDLARRLGKGPNVIDRILKANDMHTVRRQVGGKPNVQVRDRDIQILEAARPGVMSIASASLRLGLSEAVVSRLQRLVFAETDFRKWTKHGILATSVFSFEKKILDSKKTLWSLPEYRKLSLRWILSRQIDSDQEFVSFFKGLSDGSIAVVGSSDKSVGGLQVLRDSFENFRLSSGLCNELSVLSASQILKCDRNSILGLLELGVLMAEETQPVPMIRFDSLDAFRKDFRSVAAIATELGTSARAVVAICDRRAVPLLTVKYRTRSPQSFLRRRDEALLDMRPVGIGPLTSVTEFGKVEFVD